MALWVQEEEEEEYCVGQRQWLGRRRRGGGHDLIASVGYPACNGLQDPRHCAQLLHIAVPVVVVMVVVVRGWCGTGESEGRPTWRRRVCRHWSR